MRGVRGRAGRLGRALPTAVAVLLASTSISACVKLPIGGKRPPIPHQEPARPPIPEPRRSPVDVPSVPPADAAATLRTTSEEDDDVRRILCFVYEQFYDAETGELAMPPADELVEDVFGELAPTDESVMREKAQNVAELIEDMRDGDFESVMADVSCF